MHHGVADIAPVPSALFVMDASLQSPLPIYKYWVYCVNDSAVVCAHGDRQKVEGSIVPSWVTLRVVTALEMNSRTQAPLASIIPWTAASALACGQLCCQSMSPSRGEDNPAGDTDLRLLAANAVLEAIKECA
jgi:hypothetical protein